MSKYWLVTYKGLWLGGAAVIIAVSAAEAIELAKNDETSLNFLDVSVE